MKKYVFLTMNIGGINGAEQYIYNKMNYLKQQCWQVFIFSGRPGKIMIDGFREYEKLIHPALRFYPNCLNKREYAAVMDWFRSTLDLQAGDECVVESSNIISALWGETVSKELGCRHLVVIMQENHNYHQALRSFLTFKLRRHELSGIFEDSVQKMLKDPELPFRPDMRVRAYCNNVVQNCGERFSAQFDPNADYTIGSIGRLEKKYVPALIEQLATYFSEHSDKRYNLLLIGGCADKRRLSEIRERFEQCKNVTLVLTDNLYPIPRALVRKVDIFISAAGSAAVSYYEMVPSVKIHQVTAEPIGIFGYDMRPGENVNNQALVDRHLCDCIAQVLDRKIEIDYIEDFEKGYYEKMYAEFARQLQFGEGQKAGEYYDVSAVRYTATMYRLCRIACRIFGVKFTYRVLEWIRQLVRGSDE